MRLSKLGYGVLLASIALGASVIPKKSLDDCHKWFVSQHQLYVAKVVAWNKAHPKYHPKPQVHKQLTRQEKLHKYDLACDQFETFSYHYIILPGSIEGSDEKDTPPLDLLNVDDNSLIPAEDTPTYMPPETDTPYYSDNGYPIYGGYPCCSTGEYVPPTITETPEPSSLVLLGTGFLFAGMLLSKKFN